METKVEEISINGTVYVPKGSVEESKLNTENYCIVRTYSAGVFAGNIVKREGKEVTMSNARCLWYWEGATALPQLAMTGTNKPECCKFTCEVKEVILTEVIEILPCTEKAAKNIKGVFVWQK